MGGIWSDVLYVDAMASALLKRRLFATTMITTTGVFFLLNDT